MMKMSSSLNSYERNIKVSCFKYEDDEDDYGQLVVMYVILVEDVDTGAKHILHKRYSDFLELFTNLRELSPDIDRYKFPNKSLFNNRSQFTLERRLEGFNDFLQIVIEMKPLPEQAQDFLELKELLKDSDDESEPDVYDPMNQYEKQHSPSIVTKKSPQSARDPSPLTPIIPTYSSVDEINETGTKTEIETRNYNNFSPDDKFSKKSDRKLSNRRLPSNNSISYPNENSDFQSTIESSAEENVKKILHLIGLSSVLLAIFIYSTGVLFGMIDISKTGKGKVFAKFL